MHSIVTPNAWVVLRLPSDSLKVLQITPNTIISLGKYGSFSSNHLLSRPYHQTYELLDRVAGSSSSALRIVPASELHADTIAENTPTNPSSIIDAGDGVEFQLVGENGEVVMRSNRETIDDSAHQTLTMEEIEELKREGTGAGKDLIAKLMLSHTGIEQKTAFSLAKYKLLKTKKYLRRFTLLPLDVAMLCHWMIEEKDSSKIMEIREEMLALAGSWSNVHYALEPSSSPGSSGGRWLVVDETGGLLVAAMAERMGILYPSDSPSDEIPDTRGREFDHSFSPSNTLTLLHTNAQPNLSLLTYFHYNPNAPTSSGFHTHPLATHLLSLSWLQLISPELDTTYSSPPPVRTLAERQEMKSGKRGTYYRKLRRYNRTKHIVDSTLAGNFDGLAIASSMSPESILRHTIPLLRGGAPIVIYSPTIEPLVQLTDYYSTSRRTAFIQSPPASFTAIRTETPLSDEAALRSEATLGSEDALSTEVAPSTEAALATEAALSSEDAMSMVTTLVSTETARSTEATLSTEEARARWKGDEDFPLNPTLVLNASVQSARVREWQVLPGRTHPKMTGRGGAEGYLFTGVRVRPAEGRVEARGKFVRKKAKPDDVVEKDAQPDKDWEKAANGADVLKQSTQPGVESRNGNAEDVEMEGS